MVEVKIDYLGQLRCVARHSPSGEKLHTDAPVDNHGRGEFFSPTDLLATALGTCMETIMGITAERKGVNLEGLRIVVGKIMSDDLPRRVVALEVDIYMPISENHLEKKLLQSAALSCPVHHSLHPDIKVPIRWFWRAQQAAADPHSSPEAMESKEMRSNAAEVSADDAVFDPPSEAKAEVEESPLSWLRRRIEEV